MKEKGSAARALLCAAPFLALGLCSFLTWRRADWWNCFIPAGTRLRTGQNIFEAGYFYPPFQALLAAPFSYFPPLLARVFWALINAVAAGVFVRSAWKFAGGEWPARKEIPSRREVLVLVLGLGAAAGFTLDAVTNGQTDLILAALLVAGCALTFKPTQSGPVLIGTAAAAKCTPLIFLPWLAWRARPRAAAVALVVAIAANLLDHLFFPTADGQLRLVTWIRNYFAPLLSPNYIPGTWATNIEFNHSLAGFLQRQLPANVVRPAWLLVAAVMLLLALIAIGRARADSARARELAPSEAGIILCLALLLSPASSKPHFCVLLFPAWLVAREGLLRRDRFLLALSVAVATAGLLPNKDLVGRALYDGIKWSGVITLETVALFVGSLRVQQKQLQRLAGTSSSRV